LALLIFWLVVLRPLAGVYLLIQMQAATEADPATIARSTWLINTSFFWINFLAVAALSIYAGLRLVWDRTTTAVTTAIWVLWITSLIAASALLIAQAYLQGGVGAGDIAYTLGVNIAVAAAWTLYLKRSRRVQRTYLVTA
jgi:hypothetical protein